MSKQENNKINLTDLNQLKVLLEIKVLVEEEVLLRACPKCLLVCQIYQEVLVE
jgi:hypothetical protein